MNQGDAGEEKENQRIEKYAQDDCRRAQDERREDPPLLPPSGHWQIAPPTVDFRGSITYPPAGPGAREARVDARPIATL